MKEQSVELRTVAFHEAGHAIVTYSFRIPLLSVTLEPEQKDERNILGLVSHAAVSSTASIAELLRNNVSLHDPSLYLRKKVANKIVMICLAGWCAEAIMRGETVVSMNRWALDWEQAWNEAELFRGDPEKYINRRVQPTADILVKHWASVEALAMALLERQTLSGEEAESIIKATWRQIA